MIKAIIYKSKTGHTKKYAEMLGEKLNMPFYEIKEAEKELNRNDEIIYLGWVCATRIVGSNKVLKKYKVNCCGAVGAYPKTDENVQNIKNANNIKIPLFCCQFLRHEAPAWRGATLSPPPPAAPDRRRNPLFSLPSVPVLSRVPTCFILNSISFWSV